MTTARLAATILLALASQASNAQQPSSPNLPARWAATESDGAHIVVERPVLFGREICAAQALGPDERIPIESLAVGQDLGGGLEITSLEMIRGAGGEMTARFIAIERTLERRHMLAFMSARAAAACVTVASFVESDTALEKRFESQVAEFETVARAIRARVSLPMN